jgi:hypothetical protein
MTRSADRPPRNLPASVRDRLTQRARDRRENVQLVLTRYALERLLFRIGRSKHRERFVLKGAMLFTLWSDAPYRSTGDLDLLGLGDPSPGSIDQAFREILAVNFGDGVSFRPETVRVEAAGAGREYQGLRVRLHAQIAEAQLALQVDIGYGDAVTPAAREIEYPSLLDMPAPRIKAYPPETVVAEKLQAAVVLGMPNSRMKDFFDLWAIGQTFSFDGAVLARAIAATFARRETAALQGNPIALSPVFAKDATKQAQWTAFLRRSEIAQAPTRFAGLHRAVRRFVAPPLKAVARGESFARVWRPGGPWSGGDHRTR